MVMEEGVATALDPDINMWETAEPFLTEWARSELGPEARIADEIVKGVRMLRRLPELIRRIDHYYPPPGGAPPAPPLRDIERTRLVDGWRYLLVAAAAAAAGVAVTVLLLG
jgi:ubiquinone biosynthesis protein